MLIRFLIISVVTGLAFGLVDSKIRDPLEEALIKDIDQEGSESRQSTVQVVRPLTFGAAVQAEVQRLQALQDVFLPKGLSYFTPYGDRTIISLRFPSISKELLAKANKAGYGYGPNNDATPEDQYGPPKNKYGPPNQKQDQNKPAGDLGVIISQNYIFRENVRDYFNFSKLNQSRPSSELVIDLAKAFAERVNQESSAGGFPFGGHKSQSASRNPGFVLVSIESLLRTSPESSRFGFSKGGSYTNGTIIFPSPSNPAVLTNVPFILRNSKDIDHVFDGYQSNSDGLIPKEKLEIKNFLRLLSGIHEDIHDEGREKIETLRILSGRLQRPRLPDHSAFESDALVDREARARLTNWLQTSTVGIRILSSGLSGEDGYQPDSNYGVPNTANSYGSPLKAPKNKVNSYAPPNIVSNSYGPLPPQKKKNSHESLLPLPSNLYETLSNTWV